MSVVINTAAKRNERLLKHDSKKGIPNSNMSMMMDVDVFNVFLALYKLEDTMISL